MQKCGYYPGIHVPGFLQVYPQNTALPGILVFADFADLAAKMHSDSLWFP